MFKRPGVFSMMNRYEHRLIGHRAGPKPPVTPGAASFLLVRFFQVNSWNLNSSSAGEPPTSYKWSYYWPL